MSDGPRIKRYGDSWDLAFDDVGIGLQFDRVRDKADDIGSMVRVESTRPTRQGRVVGPQRLNLLSATGQQNLARAIAERLTDLKKEVAFSVVTTACAIVVEQYMKPSPVVFLDEDIDFGPTAYQAPMIPLNETTFVYGDSESCKSLITLLIGLCVQTGQPLPWSQQVIPAAKVLVLDWETQQRTVAGRLKRLASGLLVPTPRVAYRGTLWQRDASPLRMLDDEVPALREYIIREDIGLVIVDSIGFAVRGKLVDDDVARGAIADLRLLPCTRLVVAHISKESAARAGGRVDPFGSAFFRAGLRSGFEVRRSEEDLIPGRVDLGIYHWKANDDVHTPPFGLSVTFAQEEGPITIRPERLMDTPDLAGRAPLNQRLRELLRGGAMDTRELAEAAGESIETTGRTLERMPSVMKLIAGGGRGHPATWGLRE